jgi:DNA-binding protein H-NS
MARKKKETVELSLTEIQDKLAQVETDRKALEAALKTQRAAELTEFANQIRDQITKHGYTVDEVFAALNKGRRKASGKRSAGDYIRYIDPNNPERGYSRGPLPEWLREMMIAEGYDVADKAQREDFKANYLTQAA